MTPRTIDTPGLRFAALEQGTGPLALCLHGFPDCARSFRHQMPMLAERGYHVVAPWMRGYAPTGVPADGRYDAVALGQDVVALLDALGAEEALVLGHDWGAAAAYTAAMLAPGRVRGLITAAVPYGPAFFRALATDYAQMRRSWYMFFFQQGIAEAAVAHDDFAFIDRLFRDWSPGWECPSAEREAVKQSFRQPGTLAAALGYYRGGLGAAFADPAVLEATAGGMAMPIDVPALYLHGADDGCIGAELAEGMAAFFPRGLRTELIPGAGHFVHQEQPERVNASIDEFLRTL